MAVNGSKTTENDDQVRTSHRRGPMGRLWQWDTNFLVSAISGRGGYLLQEASACPVISLYPPLSDDGGPKWDCVFFQMSQCLKMESESWSEWNGRENGSARQARNTVKLQRFPSFLRVGCLSPHPPMPDKYHKFLPQKQSCFFFFLNKLLYLRLF